MVVVLEVLHVHLRTAQLATAVVEPRHTAPGEA